MKRENTETVKAFLAEKLGLKSCKSDPCFNPFSTIMETDTNILFCVQDMFNPSSAFEALEQDCLNKIKRLNDIIDDINSCRSIFIQKKD